jgi:predicted RNA binding protein YcfA (HicA-like mRNA interferase family)
MNRLPRISGKVMLKFLKSQGYVLRRISGSHHFMEKGHLGTTIPVHGNSNIRIGTLCGILREIEMEPEEFRRKFQKL